MIRNVLVAVLAAFSLTFLGYDVGGQSAAASKKATLLGAQESGVVSGLCLPAGAGAIVHAFEPGTFDQGAADPFENSVGSASSSVTGGFLLAGLASGYYDIVVRAAGYETDLLGASIEVRGGMRTLLPRFRLIRGN